MTKKNTKDFIWNSVGSLIFGFTSLIYMILITRINSIEEAGIFTYAFACASVFFTIGNYSGKTYQVTETNSSITDSDYLYNRLFTIAIMFLCSIVFCLFSKNSTTQIIMIILLTIYRAIDSLIESIHAIVQRNKELYKVGMSLFFRTIILILAFFIINTITHNMITSTIFLVIINFLYCLLIDYHLIKGKYTITKFNRKRNMQLLKAGFFVFCYSFLSMYVLNATKYAMNNFASYKDQAIYGIIIMPASFLSMIATYIIQPFLNTITEKIKKSQKKELLKLFYKLSFGIIAIGLLAILVCSFIGIPILELVYNTFLENELKNLLIILVGSIFYSLTILMSSIFIATRKTISQLVILIIIAIFSLITCNILTSKMLIDGASLSYVIIMGLGALLHYLVLLYIMKEKKKKVTIRLMGGLGNQMFEYCALRSKMLDENIDGAISLKGLTNKGHNIYSLNHFNISKEIELNYKTSLKGKLNYLLYGFYFLFLVKRKNGFRIMQKIQPLLNYFGLYCIVDGYMKIKRSSTNYDEMIGYFQSLKYFNSHEDILKEELKVKEEVLPQNKLLLEEIRNNNSVCIHIRRGDYMGSNHEVCNVTYYLKAIKEIQKRTKNAKFYVFSDDIKWVKENINFPLAVTLVENNNPNYEELRLMYSCKHFIISNSSFSFWAQFLGEDENKITVAPSKWFQNENQRVDIYQDNWIIIKV